MNYRQITVPDFIGALLGGIYDLSRVRLVDANLAGDPQYGELLEYLRRRYQNVDILNLPPPIVLDYADLAGLTAPNLFVPFLRGVGINLRGADLQGSIFTLAYLPSLDCNGANLTSANFGYAIAPHASFQNAILTGANLNMATLPFACFESARLDLADLRRSHLKGVNLTGADLSRTNLKEADLSGACLVGTDLRGADLTGVIGLPLANLYGVIVDETTIIAPPDRQWFNCCRK